MSLTTVKHSVYPFLTASSIYKKVSIDVPGIKSIRSPRDANTHVSGNDTGQSHFKSHSPSGVFTSFIQNIVLCVMRFCF